jgi:hypothetical protein
MSSIQFPASFVKMILVFESDFTRPSFRHFQVVLASILLGKPKKTLTAGIRLLGVVGHFCNPHRFLGRYKWKLINVIVDLFGLLQQDLSLGTELVFALDDTLVPKYGHKIFGRGCHFDHACRPNRPKYILGHNWVVMGLLYHCGLFSKWLCFPLLAQLFIPEKALTKGQVFRSRIQIAVEMVTQMKALVRGSVTLVADGLYAKKDLIRSCIAEGITFISRLRCDASLYEIPKPPKVKARGRPRKYGKKLGTLGELGAQPKGFVTYRLKLYGTMRTVRVKRIVAMWEPAGAPIAVFITQFKGEQSLAYFFSTDLTLDVERMLTLVAARWSIENLFNDMKEHLGMKQWQCRIEGAVVRSVPLTCVATSLLMLWSLSEAGQKAPEFWDVFPWQTKKASPSIQDMIDQLKTKCISAQIFHVLQQKGITAEKYPEIDRIVKRAA